MIKNIVLGLSLTLAASSLFVTLMKGRNKSVYINTVTIYQEFSLSKELNKDLEKILRSRKFIVDSLFEDLRLQSEAIQKDGGKNKEMMKVFQKNDEEFVYKKEQFEKENESLTNEYNAKIWNQINQYILDYGLDNEYTFIFGANGQGNIMYGDTERDVTKDVIKYINERYEGRDKK